MDKGKKDFVKGAGPAQPAGAAHKRPRPDEGSATYKSQKTSAGASAGGPPPKKSQGFKPRTSGGGDKPRPGKKITKDDQEVSAPFCGDHSSRAFAATSRPPPSHNL
jgi:hypothetical protein